MSTDQIQLDRIQSTSSRGCCVYPPYPWAYQVYGNRPDPLGINRIHKKSSSLLLPLCWPYVSACVHRPDRSRPIPNHSEQCEWLLISSSNLPAIFMALDPFQSDPIQSTASVLIYPPNLSADPFQSDTIQPTVYTRYCSSSSGCLYFSRRICQPPRSKSDQNPIHGRIDCGS